MLKEICVWVSTASFVCILVKGCFKHQGLTLTLLSLDTIEEVPFGRISSEAGLDKCSRSKMMKWSYGRCEVNDDDIHLLITMSQFTPSLENSIFCLLNY